MRDDLARWLVSARARRWFRRSAIWPALAVCQFALLNADQYVHLSWTTDVTLFFAAFAVTVPGLFFSSIHITGMIAYLFLCDRSSRKLPWLFLFFVTLLFGAPIYYALVYRQQVASLPLPRQPEPPLQVRGLLRHGLGGDAARRVFAYSAIGVLLTGVAFAAPMLLLDRVNSGGAVAQLAFNVIFGGIGVFGAISAITNFVGMLVYLFACDKKSTKAWWLILFGITGWYGTAVYYLFVYRRQVGAAKSGQASQGIR